MIYLTDLEKITEDKYKVNRIVYQVNILNMTEQELRQNGMLIEKLDNFEIVEGKIAILFCNPSSNEVWYEYEDKILSREEELENQVLELTEERDRLLKIISENNIKI